MAIYKTPGVYVEEISLLPPSVAQVETAIPAFIGYTALSEKDGQDLKNVPTRITSMLEYVQYFGGAYSFGTSDFSISLDETNGFKVLSDSFKVTKLFNMYNSVRHYFDNGGGPCYIVSVGGYKDDVAAGDEATGTPGLRVGIKALEKYDEPTIIAIPDAANLGKNEFYALQQMAVAQAGILQDRVVLLDLREYDADLDVYAKESKVSDVHGEFRDHIGINDLKYAAAYTPWLISTYAPEIPYPVLKGSVKAKDGKSAVNLAQVTSNAALNALVQKTEAAVTDLANVKSVIATGKEPAATPADRFNDLKSLLSAAASDDAAKTAFLNLLTYVRGLVKAIPSWKGAAPLVNTQLLSDLDASAKDVNAGLAATLKALISFEKNADVALFAPMPATAEAYTDYDAPTVSIWWKVFPKEDFDGNVIATVDKFKATTTDYGAAADKATALKAAADLENIFRGLLAFLNKIQTSAAKYVSSNQSALYATHPVIAAVVTALQTKLAIVPPSGAIAGVYAKTDRERGVWKAPANTSLNSVSAPLVKIDNNTQDGLNVDTDAGKSINAIRAFSGKGTLVWGARTLDGNSNEWRYISVRRLFNMVEESVKKSTAPFVFEPNDANTWVKVKGMVENYLTTLWRQGALAGAKTDQAFFVRVGLGQTMTEQDILEGRLIVEIGMAAVRPAEFIILRFSHKMQES
ncbi:hypothetical protein SAMN05444266_103190 [Chitinophaga jiangningensis]|uniref:Tail sheath protein C-terminal domain-containing protein n=1 Tax=Chitinophaga jiangningensis TaxID=1419482 RepID=A0A1M7A9Y2_9BACT|nr:phage tail sheath C-terminal domain-containing protein [Chitinophaga jiangningensis]SHL39531.1 hypothetical protein SAMN05444266_103190 [Chitinophaga jiangningensis]